MLAQLIQGSRYTVPCPVRSRSQTHDMLKEAKRLGVVAEVAQNDPLLGKGAETLWGKLQCMAICVHGLSQPSKLQECAASEAPLLRTPGIEGEHMLVGLSCFLAAIQFGKRAAHVPPGCHTYRIQ